MYYAVYDTECQVERLGYVIQQPKGPCVVLRGAFTNTQIYLSRLLFRRPFNPIRDSPVCRGLDSRCELFQASDKCGSRLHAPCRNLPSSVQSRGS
jgi:hypothetical protein